MNNKTPSCSLSELLASALSDAVLAPIKDIRVTGITLDSRQVIEGGVFVALKGVNSNGADYIASAIAKGCHAVLCELDGEEANKVTYVSDVPVVHIKNLNGQLSTIASVFYQYPQHDLKLIGITGTNGKTTVTQLISQWLECLGHRTYSLGTLGNGFTGQLVESPNTTLNAIDLIAHLADAKTYGAEYVVMEVSSHGLALGRVKALTFDVAAFTNLSQDHLDFHGDMGSYANAKKQLFSAQYSKEAVLNGNDATALAWAQDWHYENAMSSFGQKLPHASHYLLASDVRYQSDGISATIESSFGQGHLQSQLLGQFNLDNLLCAINVLCLVGLELSAILKLAPMIEAVPGRMEVFQVANSPTVVVDYAHTPDALAQAIQACRRHCHGTLYALFGCGGDRDNSKRPQMAQAAQKHADGLIITQDNSRSESFDDILQHILSGLMTREHVVVEANRQFAVVQAINSAQYGDIVLLAGKGHENYQLIDQQRIDYDERALAKQTVESYK